MQHDTKLQAAINAYRNSRRFIDVDRHRVEFLAQGVVGQGLLVDAELDHQEQSLAIRHLVGLWSWLRVAGSGIGKGEGHPGYLPAWGGVSA